MTNNIISMMYSLPALLMAITFHEVAHGYTAFLLGDPTAKNQGRLTLNPIKHIDPIGFITLLIFRFGWAKPVPYNPYYFKNRKRGTILVALAGPLTNIIIAFLSLIVLYFSTNTVIKEIFYLSYLYNIFFASFNIIPIPPLDGSKIFSSIIPNKLRSYIWKLEQYGQFILILLIISGLLKYILNPIIIFFDFIVKNLFNLIF